MSKKGYKMSEESKARMRKPKSEQGRANINAARKTHTPEALAKMAATKTGKKASPEHRAAISRALTGRIRPQEERDAISRGQKGLRLGVIMGPNSHPPVDSGLNERTCVQCNKQFPIRLGQNLILYCGELCHLEHNAGPRPLDPTKCWLWHTRINAQGYATSRYRGDENTPGAHRRSYQFFKGPIPKGFEIRHTCHCRRCINPDHLVVGTHRQNMDDMLAAGRSTRGSKIHSSTLTERQVLEVFISNASAQTLATSYGVRKGVITAIIEQQYWGWLTCMLREETYEEIDYVIDYITQHNKDIETRNQHGIV